MEFWPTKMHIQNVEKWLLLNMAIFGIYVEFIGCKLG